MGEPFKLQVDASKPGAGALLLQTGDDGLDHPVSFISRKFNFYQFNYSIVEKEALPLIWALQHFVFMLGVGWNLLFCTLITTPLHSYIPCRTQIRA